MIILGIILTVIGILLLVSFFISHIRCRTETEAAVSKVIVKEHYHRGRTIKDCTPVFTYTVNGKEYTAKSEHSTRDPKKYFVGQKHIIFTDADHPESIRHGSDAGYGIAGVVIALLGIGIIVLYFL